MCCGNILIVATENQLTVKRVHFLCNGVYTSKIGGGDIHMIHLARAAMTAGYAVNFFGGHALQRQLEAQLSGHSVTFTDGKAMPSFNDSTLGGQIRMFFDYWKRLQGTLKQLSAIKPHDLAYAVGDFWYDVIPLIRSEAAGKLMIFHMQAPTFREIAMRSRADVDLTRLASLHYATSQSLSLLRFRRCPRKRLLFLHPAMRERLLRLDYRPEELRYIPFGVAPRRPSGVAPKKYDVIWIGRKHRQKGVEDLLQTLVYLKNRMEGFRAVLIGNLRADLQAEIDRLGLGQCVEFPGFISEDQKFNLMEASRVFLMPSRFEGSPRVIAEALVSEVPVVAYAVATYRPLFGDLVQYVPCYDLSAFQSVAEAQVQAARYGNSYLQQQNLDTFREQNSWKTVEQIFCDTLADLQNKSHNR